jgi:Na+/H+ antiporter NhaD/arsenite permease-like protein
MTKFLLLLTALLPSIAFATDEVVTDILDLTNHWVGYTALALFATAYILVMVEEFTHFRKSKPVILVAGVIWGLIGWVYASNGLPHSAEIALRHNILEYSELFLFLLVAMTYIEAMRERLVFESLKVWLINKGYTFRQLFWITGFLAFFISPVADNLTTALIMGAVVMAVGAGNPRFISIAFVNIVVAANAGGAFSPFGTILTI